MNQRNLLCKFAISLALSGALLTAQAPIANAVPTDSSSHIPLTQKVKDVRRASATCGVDFGATRKVTNSIEHGGRVSCYGTGNISADVFLLKEQPDGDWVTVSYHHKEVFGSSTGATYVDSDQCNNSKVRSYYAVVQGQFEKATGSGQSGNFHEVSGTVSLPCNLLRV